MGVYSFCQNKIVATGEGGAVVTDDDELAAEVRLYRSHGRASNEYFDAIESGSYHTLGTNIRMPDITAAIGCSQLDKVDELVGGRRDAATYMNERLSEVDGVRVPCPRESTTHVYQLYTIELDPVIDRKTVIETLETHGVSSKIYWDTPAHRTRYYRETQTVDYPDLSNTDETARRVLSLPMYPDLKQPDTDRIVEAVKRGVEKAN
jgi:dTDP-4-amino-4,6-dideoxygalactose transaminase